MHSLEVTSTSASDNSPTAPFAPADAVGSFMDKQPSIPLDFLSEDNNANDRDIEEDLFQLFNDDKAGDFFADLDLHDHSLQAATGAATAAATAAVPGRGLQTEQPHHPVQQQQQQNTQPLKPTPGTPQTASTQQVVYVSGGPLNPTSLELPPQPPQHYQGITTAPGGLGACPAHGNMQPQTPLQSTTPHTSQQQWQQQPQQQQQQQAQGLAAELAGPIPDSMQPPKGQGFPAVPQRANLLPAATDPTLGNGFSDITDAHPVWGHSAIQQGQPPAAAVPAVIQSQAAPYATLSSNVPYHAADPVVQANGQTQRCDGSYGPYGPGPNGSESYGPGQYVPVGLYGPGSVPGPPAAGYPFIPSSIGVPPPAANAMPGMLQHVHASVHGNGSASLPGGALAPASAAATSTAAAAASTTAINAVTPTAPPPAQDSLAQAIWAAYSNPTKAQLIESVLLLVLGALGSGGGGSGGTPGGPTYNHWRALERACASGGAGGGGGGSSSGSSGGGQPAGPLVRVCTAVPKRLLAQIFAVAADTSASDGGGSSRDGAAGVPAQQGTVQAGRQPQGDRVVWVGPKEPDTSAEPQYLMMSGGWKQVKLTQLQQGTGSGQGQGQGQGRTGLEAWPGLAQALMDGRLYLAHYVTYRRCLQGHDTTLHNCIKAGPPHAMHTVYTSWLVERKEVASQAAYEEQQRTRKQTGHSRILQLPATHKGAAPSYAWMAWQPEWPAWWVAKPPESGPTPRRTGARPKAAQQQQVSSAVPPPTALETAQAATATAAAAVAVAAGAAVAAAAAAAAAAGEAAAAGAAAPPEAQLQALTLAGCPSGPTSPTGSVGAPVADVGHPGGGLTAIATAAAKAAAVAAADENMGAGSSGRASLQREKLHVQGQQKRRTAPPAEPAADAHRGGYGKSAVVAQAAPQAPAGSSGTCQAGAATAAAGTHSDAGQHAGPPADAVAVEDEAGATAGDAEDAEGPPDARRRRTSAEQPAGAGAAQEFKLSEEDAARVKAVEEAVRFFLTRGPAAQPKYMEVMLQEELPSFQDVQTLCFGNKSGYGLLNIIIHVPLRLAGAPADESAAALPPRQPDAAPAAAAAAAAATGADTGASAGMPPPPAAAAEAAEGEMELAAAAGAAEVEAEVGAAAGEEAAAATATADLPWDCPALDEEQQERLEALLVVVLQHYGPEQGTQLLLQRGTKFHDTALHTCCRYGLLRVLQHLLPRCDKAVLLAATKSHWHALHTACRARQAACAVEVLRRAMQLGLIGREDCSSATAELLLSAPQFNPYYKDYRGREVLDRAISQVWSVAGGREAAPSDACPSHVSVTAPVPASTTTLAPAPAPAPAPAATPWCVTVLSDEEQLKGLWMRACPPYAAGTGQERGQVQGQQEER